MIFNFLIRMLLGKGGRLHMVSVYIALIVYKVRTNDSVPKHLQDEVLAGLEALGLDGYGNPTAT
jgi:hypothetical protein